LADRLNGVLNRTVSDSRLSVVAIDDDRNAFELTRLVDAVRAPCELDGTTAQLRIQHGVVIDDGQCRTESYSYRLQAEASPRSWLVRWDYVRDPSQSDYAYPRAHVHMNGTFFNGAPVERLHIPTRRVPLELVIRHLITDWNVKPRSGDWETILGESVEDFC